MPEFNKAHTLPTPQSGVGVPAHPSLVARSVWLISSATFSAECPALAGKEWHLLDALPNSEGHVGNREEGGWASDC